MGFFRRRMIIDKVNWMCCCCGWNVLVDDRIVFCELWKYVKIDSKIKIPCPKKKLLALSFHYVHKKIHWSLSCSGPSRPGYTVDELRMYEYEVPTTKKIAPALTSFLI